MALHSIWIRICEYHDQIAVDLNIAQAANSWDLNFRKLLLLTAKVIFGTCKSPVDVGGGKAEVPPQPGAREPCKDSEPD